MGGRPRALTSLLNLEAGLKEVINHLLHHLQVRDTGLARVGGRLVIHLAKHKVLRGSYSHAAVTLCILERREPK